MPRKRKLRIATFNINGVNARLSNLLEWLEKEDPDIVALQELKATDDAFPVKALERAGYGCLWNGEKSWNGVALLARGSEPVESRRKLPGGRADKQSRYIEAAVLGVVVAGIYAPNGNPQPGPKFQYKIEWMARLARHAQTLVNLPHPVVLLGDFNIIPTDNDVYEPKSFRKSALFQPEIQKAYGQLLEAGWTDALKTTFGDERIYTFWDYFRSHAERDRGLRIDHILCNPVLASCITSAGVDRWVRLREKPSDHAPTWINVSLG